MSEPRCETFREEFKDFTHHCYRQFLRSAARNWRFRGFTDFNRDERFVLWRHDVDFSLEAAAALGEIDAEEGVRSTFFLHPHSEFYNILEADGKKLVRRLLDKGHQIGLHFDTHYHEILDEQQLNEAVRWEANLLQRVVGQCIDVFSFHNTTPFTMACKAGQYGGCINTYAHFFQQDVGYVSDSNGVWNHRNLGMVLEQAADERLQVLTHPEWWWPIPMAPREKVWRFISRRAEKTITHYDELLLGAGRNNVYGLSSHLAFFSSFDAVLHRTLDRLWNDGLLLLLFVELLRTYENHKNGLCAAMIAQRWKVPDAEIQDFLDGLPSSCSTDLFDELSVEPSSEITAVTNKEMEAILLLRNRLVEGHVPVSLSELEDLCVRVSDAFAKLITWGVEHGFVVIPGLRVGDGLSRAVDRGDVPLSEPDSSKGSNTRPMHEPLATWIQLRKDFAED